MKFTCDSQKLVDAVSNVQRAVSPKSCLTALEGVLLKTQDDKIGLCGYNLEIGITTEVDADVEDEGEIVLSAKIFLDIIRRAPADEITITVDEKFVTTITSGPSEFSIVGMSAAEYPELPSINDHTDLCVESSVLKSMIKQTIFAVAENDEKPINTGTLFDLNNNELNLVSVDGYRLAKRTEILKDDTSLEKNNFAAPMTFVAPGKTLFEILKLISDEGFSKISVGKKHILFQIDNYCIISRLLEGDFLDYNAAIPKEFTTEVTVNTRKFIESVERVSLVITDRLKSPLRCNFSDTQLKISCITALGKAHDEFEVDVNGDDIEIGFNNKYLLDALKNVDTDQIRIQMCGPLGPMKITPIEGNSFVFLVLPVRLKTND